MSTLAKPQAAQAGKPAKPILKDFHLSAYAELRRPCAWNAPSGDIGLERNPRRRNGDFFFLGRASPASSTVELGCGNEARPLAPTPDSIALSSLSAFPGADLTAPVRARVRKSQVPCVDSLSSDLEGSEHVHRQKYPDRPAAASSISPIIARSTGRALSRSTWTSSANTPKSPAPPINGCTT